MHPMGKCSMSGYSEADGPACVVCSTGTTASCICPIIPSRVLHIIIVDLFKLVACRTCLQVAGLGQCLHCKLTILDRVHCSG